MNHIIYHNDNDGRAAAAVVKRYLELQDAGPSVCQTATYGEGGPTDIDYELDTVYLVDFTYQEAGRMAELAGLLGDRFIWIDHHQGALDLEAQSDAVKAIPGLRMVGDAPDKPLAGCELAWRHLFPLEKQPLILTWVGDWDTWRAMNTDRKFDVWAFDTGLYDMRAYPDKRAAWWRNLLTDESDDFWEKTIQGIVEKGRVFVEFERKKNRSLLHSQGFETTLITEDREYRVLAVNSNGGSLTFSDYFDPERHQAVMKFFWVGMSHLSVGLYSDDPDFDCNKICHELGHTGPLPSGGGHKGAGGFQTHWGHFTTLTKNHTLLKTLSKK
jgi:hypothetical protein